MWVVGCGDKSLALLYSPTVGNTHHSAAIGKVRLANGQANGQAIALARESRTGGLIITGVDGRGNVQLTAQQQ